MSQRKKMQGKEVDILLELFYEGSTTSEQEALLRQFLTSPAASDSRYDADRAVMSLQVVGRRKFKHKAAVQRLRFSAIAAAASVILFIGFTTMRHAVAPNYLAYVNGQKYTDRDFVISQIALTMENIAPNDEQASVENQLRAVINGAFDDTKGDER